MPQVRYETIETYDNKGNVIATEQIPCEVSDEEMQRAKAETVVAGLSTLSDVELTITKLRGLVKALAGLRR